MFLMQGDHDQSCPLLARYAGAPPRDVSHELYDQIGGHMSYVCILFVASG